MDEKEAAEPHNLTPMRLAEFEDKKEDKKGKRISIRLILAIIVIVVAILIKLPSVSQESHMEEFPINLTLTVVEGHNRTVADCQSRNFSWSYRWDGWVPPEGDRISPRFWLTNDQNESGYFEVQFAFFDDKVYRFEDFSTKEVANVPWGNAAMSSDRVRVFMQPNETQMISILTQKRQSDSVYWTYADVLPPTFQACYPRNEYIESLVTKNITKYVSRNVTTCMVNYDYWWRRLLP